MADTPTSARLPDPGVRDLFTREARWQAWLDVEAALARAEASLGMIPAEAAVEGEEDAVDLGNEENGPAI